MREEDVIGCEFQNWFPAFQKLTFKSKVLPLPEELVTYFRTDGLGDIPQHVTRDDDNDSVSSGWCSELPDSEEEGEARVSETAVFKEFQQRVNEAIVELKGAVLPKLNWSSPKDSCWMTCLQCRSFSDICLLFKSSDFIEHDLGRAFDYCSPPRRTRPDTFSLVLRRWHDINPASEFRCFVKHGRLVGITQRETTTVYDHLLEQGERNHIKTAITSFYESEILPRHADWQGGAISSYVFDVYVDIPPRRRVWLIDISPMGEGTLPLLFDWDEQPLAGWSEQTDCSTDEVEFRVVRNRHERQNKVERYHAMPKELAELAVGGTSETLQELLAKAEKNAKTN